MGGQGERVPAVTLPANGPAADYPMVIGAPYSVDGVTYTPADKLNYDAVGYAFADAGGGDAITGSHRTLPLPSYAEVTALDSGKTVLVRMERRGPMTGTGLVALSPGASLQLAINGRDKVAVRVRRVNPPEFERAQLRRGEHAADRMETPKPLLAVLMRKLDLQDGGAPPKPALPGVAVSPTPAVVVAPVVKPVVALAPVASTPTGRALVVQVAAFSTRDRADGVATKLGGKVSSSGRFWRVQIGPYAQQAEADAALVKAKSAGYSDARIQRAG